MSLEIGVCFVALHLSDGLRIFTQFALFNDIVKSLKLLIFENYIPHDLGNTFLYLCGPLSFTLYYSSMIRENISHTFKLHKGDKTIRFN